MKKSLYALLAAMAVVVAAQCQSVAFEPIRQYCIGSAYFYTNTSFTNSDLGCDGFTKLYASFDGTLSCQPSAYAAQCECVFTHCTQLFQIVANVETLITDNCSVGPPGVHRRACSFLPWVAPAGFCMSP